MVSQTILIAIIIGVFFAGLGGGYAILQANQPNFTMMNSQQMQQMMSNPQLMNQWHQAMLQNPQAMNQWMNTMMSNPQLMNQWHQAIMNNPQLQQQMYQNMFSNQQFMQGMMSNQQFQNQWMYPMMQNWNGTWSGNYGMMGPGMMSEMMGKSITGNTQVLSTITNIKKLLDDASSAYSSGDKDKAFSIATTAYLENYEYIESAISQKDNSLKEKVELEMRVDLRSMINNGDSIENVNSKISSIKSDLDKIELLFK